MATDEAKDAFWNMFTSFSKRHSKQELYHDSQKWRVPLGPVNKPSDIYESAQLRNRDFFVEVEAFGRSIKMPGAPYKLSDSPWRLTGAAPRLGEHTAEILTELHFDKSERDRLFRDGAVS